MGAGDRQENERRAARRRLIFSLILLAGGLVYAVYPLDLIPDILGPIGWVDDIGLLLATSLYSAYSYGKVRGGREPGS